MMIISREMGITSFSGCIDYIWNDRRKLFVLTNRKSFRFVWIIDYIYKKVPILSIFILTTKKIYKSDYSISSLFFRKHFIVVYYIPKKKRTNASSFFSTYPSETHFLPCLFDCNFPILSNGIDNYLHFPTNFEMGRKTTSRFLCQIRDVQESSLSFR